MRQVPFCRGSFEIQIHDMIWKATVYLLREIISRLRSDGPLTLKHIVKDASESLAKLAPNASPGDAYVGKRIRCVAPRIELFLNFECPPESKKMIFLSIYFLLVNQSKLIGRPSKIKVNEG